MCIYAIRDHFSWSHDLNWKRKNLITFDIICIELKVGFNVTQISISSQLSRTYI